MTQEEALAKLSDAIDICRKAGLSVNVISMYGGGQAPLFISLPEGTRYLNGCLFISDGEMWSRSEEMGFVDTH